jgi:hypothetical protein
MTDKNLEIYRRRSIDALREVARQLRRVVDYPDDLCFPIMHVIEMKLDQQLDVLRLEVWSEEEMSGYEGLTFRDAECDRLVLSERIYQAACLGQWRARRIAAHELGHWLLHTPFYRRDMYGHGRRLLSALETEPAWLEDEADIFAVELLMPMKHIALDDTALDLSVRFGAPLKLAEARLAAADNAWKRKRTVVAGGPSKLVTGQRG